MNIFIKKKQLQFLWLLSIDYKKNGSENVTMVSANSSCFHSVTLNLDGE